MTIGPLVDRRERLGTTLRRRRGPSRPRPSDPASEVSTPRGRRSQSHRRRARRHHQEPGPSRPLTADRDPVVVAPPAAGRPAREVATMLYLSQAIGRPVLDANGEPLGKVDDLIVAVGDRYPPVTGLVVATDRRRIFLPWSQVARFDASGARLSTDQIDITKFQQRAERDPAARRPARQADRRHRRAQGRPRQRPPPRRRRGPAPPRRRRRRGGRPAAPARDRGRLPDPRPQPATCRRPSATSTGRTSTRSRRASPRSSCASRTPA